jgi:hypothetical protein
MPFVTKLSLFMLEVRYSIPVVGPVEVTAMNSDLKVFMHESSDVVMFLYNLRTSLYLLTTTHGASAVLYFSDTRIQIY